MLRINKNLEMSVLAQLLFTLLLIFLHADASQSQDGPVVATNSGKIRGFLEHSSKGKNFYTFHKIPFAEPPTGKLRFKNPQEGKTWDGILDGSQETIGCPCPEFSSYLKDESLTYEGGEDCLYLSVSTPKISKDLLPVLVWIHGGAFISESSNMFGPHELMNEDVVYAALDYRLGILGFLSTEDDVMPGNLGLKDQTLALKWIHENIHHFGGDPTRITIFGNSAGGASVHYQVLSPASKGLFNAAVLQSGTALCPWTHSEGHKSIAHQVGAAVGCFTPADIGKRQSERLLECLQEVDAETLTMTFKHFVTWNFLPNVFAPRVDGEFLPDHPETLMREGRHHDVNILIGVTKEDGAWLTESLYSQNDQIERLHKDFEYNGPISLGLNYENSSESMTATVYNYYLGNTKVSEENADQTTKMFGDTHFIVCSDNVAFMHSTNVKSADKRVYFYEFTYKGQRSEIDFYQIKPGKKWVGHADECFLLFPMHTVGGFPNRPSNDAQMRDTLVKLWTNFAATGNPTPDDSLGFTWEPFTAESPKHLSINLQPVMKDDQRREIRNFWATLPTRQNEWLFGLKDKTHSSKSEL